MSEKLEPWAYPLLVDYARRKVCECTEKRYLLDFQNRLVYCAGCGAIADPFDALLNIARDAERINDCLKTFSDLAEKERRKYHRYKGVNGVTEHHRNGMIPLCPKCNEPIDPADFGHFVSRKYIKKGGPQ